MGVSFLPRLYLAFSFLRRKTLQMQRNESRTQMKSGVRSTSTSSSILNGSILSEENMSNESEEVNTGGEVNKVKQNC